MVCYNNYMFFHRLWLFSSPHFLKKQGIEVHTHMKRHSKYMWKSLDSTFLLNYCHWGLMSMGTKGGTVLNIKCTVWFLPMFVFLIASYRSMKMWILVAIVVVGQLKRPPFFFFSYLLPMAFWGCVDLILNLLEVFSIQNRSWSVKQTKTS